MTKIPIYFMPGLAAGPEIFENLELSEDYMSSLFRVENTYSIRRVYC